jgi:glutathione S-transferase
VRLVPDDLRVPEPGHDRFFDNYVMTPMQKIVFDCIRADQRDPAGVADARAHSRPYRGWTTPWTAGTGRPAMNSASRTVGGAAMFYADWVQPIAEECRNVRAYRRRLLARPSFARADEARPYRSFSRRVRRTATTLRPLSAGAEGPAPCRPQWGSLQ